MCADVSSVLVNKSLGRDSTGTTLVIREPLMLYLALAIKRKLSIGLSICRIRQVKAIQWRRLSYPQTTIKNPRKRALVPWLS